MTAHDFFQGYRAAAYVFILAYPVGVPAFFGLLLYRNRHVLGRQASAGQHADKWWYGDRETLDFLVNGYRQDAFWFELVRGHTHHPAVPRLTARDTAGRLSPETADGRCGTVDRRIAGAPRLALPSRLGCTH